jgi:hypothetical protein
MLQVFDAKDNPIAGQRIHYQVTSGQGAVQLDTVLTNESGVARGRWILGPEPGEHTLEARIVDRLGQLRRIIAIFRAKAVRPAPTDQAAAIEIVAGQGQSATVGTVLPDPLVVRVLSASGTPVTGQVISYQVSAGGGRVEAIEGVSDEAGTARVRWTLGSEPGKNALEARLLEKASGRVMEAVTFTAEGMPAATNPPPAIAVGECSNPQAGWIWCDDFEQDRLAQYFEYKAANGSFLRTAGVGVDGSHGMRARWGAAGQASAGSLHLAFGKTPDSYVRPVDSGATRYREVYWRLYVRYPKDWAGGGGFKLSRAQSLASNAWAQAMVAPVWSGSSEVGRNHLVIDPVSGTSEQGALQATGYGDEPNLRYLGSARSKTPIFSDSQLGEWRCVEAHVRLNDPGQSNGTFNLWIDGALEAERSGLNWVGSYSDYGINTVFVENYWNDGAPRAQERYFDNFVVSTRPIGCGSSPSSPPAPEPPPVVGSVAVLPSQPALKVGESVGLTAWVYDADGKELSGKTVTWASSNTSVARVVSTGAKTASVEGVEAGTATVTAEVEGKSRAIAVTVSRAEPPPPSGAKPWLEIDFNKYATTAALLADTNNQGGPFYSDKEVSRISLDTSTGYGSSTKSMRYTWPDRTSQGGTERNGRCGDYTIGRNVAFPHAATEVWVEVVAKFSENFTTRAPATWGCTSNPDYKFIFGLVTSNDSRNESRYGLYNGVYGTEWHAGRPGIPEDTYNPKRGFMAGEPLNWDGKWHRYRFHWKISSPNKSDGIFRLWIDDKLVVEDTAVMTTNIYGVPTVGILGLALGRNMNQGPGHVQHLWWGAVRAWNVNPGW